MTKEKLLDDIINLTEHYLATAKEVDEYAKSLEYDNMAKLFIANSDVLRSISELYILVHNVERR